ncbi:MAG: S41 family peptidase, partial [Bacteroidetes bacterium]|nr:S41 family peptidase [Bacteroidota bacterium]
MKNLKRRILYFALPAFSILLLAAADQYYEIAKHIDIMVSVYKEVDANYVDEINHAKIMRKGIDAMLADLDPYTVFYSESEVEDYKFQQTGVYGGIGANIGQKSGKFTVLEIYKGFAADKAGMLPGDVLIEVDGKDVTDSKVKDLGPFLKGEPNTEVSIKFQRMGEPTPKIVTFNREEVKVDNVSFAKKLSNQIGYIKFSNFRDGGALEVKKHLSEFKKEGIAGLILDLRGNPGGLLREAVELVNLFVKKGEIVVTTKGKNTYNNRTYTTNQSPYDLELPIVVLIDENSASASEIVSGSLQDYDRAIIVGNTSFGKGLVQNVVPLTYNTQVKVTISKYYIPSGRCIQRLDYASKDDDGEVHAFPDSLKQEFATAGGRLVYDGAGVDPDIEVEDQKPNEVVQGLIDQYLIFDFATKFRLNNAEIGEPQEFKVDDALFAEFKQFVSGQGFDLKTKAETQLDKLKKQLK